MDDDLAMCTRCESMVESNTRMRFANWAICSDCWDDL